MPEKKSRLTLLNDIECEYSGNIWNVFPHSISIFVVSWLKTGPLGQRLKALMQEQCLSEGRPIPAPPNPRKPFKASKDVIDIGPIGCRNENVKASTGMNCCTCEVICQSSFISMWRWVWAKRSCDFVIQRMAWNDVVTCCDSYTNSCPGLLCDTVALFHFQLHITVGHHGTLVISTQCTSYCTIHADDTTLIRTWCARTSSPKLDNFAAFGNRSQQATLLPCQPHVFLGVIWLESNRISFLGYCVEQK